MTVRRPGRGQRLGARPALAGGAGLGKCESVNSPAVPARACTRRHNVSHWRYKLRAACGGRCPNPHDDRPMPISVLLIESDHPHAQAVAGALADPWSGWSVDVVESITEAHY